MNNVLVKIADMAVLNDEGVLVTLGLGSCVGIALYDRQTRVGGLAHILLDESQKFCKRGSNSFNPAKYVDTALPLLLKKMESLGASKSSVVAKIAGGSSLFNFNTGQKGVGEKNVQAARQILQDLKIELISEDVGGSHGRTMRFFVETGQVVIKTINMGEREL